MENNQQQFQAYPPNQNLNVQFQPIQNGQMMSNNQDRGYSLGIPVGQPIGYNYAQNFPQQQQYHQQIGQVVFVPMVQQVSDYVILQERIQKQSKWFNGCNTLWGIFAILSLFTRSLALMEDENSQISKTAGIIIMIENIIWLLSISLGIYGVNNFKVPFINYYQYGLVFVILFEIIASSMIISQYSDQNGKFFYVIFFIITLICLFSFIYNAKQLTIALLIWLQMKEQQEQNFMVQNNMNQNPHQR